MHRRIFAAALAVGLFSLTVSAQTPPTPPTQPTPPTRIRGKIASLDGQLLKIDRRDGQKIEVRLNDPLTVTTVKNVPLASVAPGSYIGTATRTGADGKLTAIEVLVFPEAMRGAGEGHYAWDLEPGSMMTNGAVNGVVDGTSGRELKISYKGESNSVTVPPNTPVVTFAPAERADLKAGAPVFLSATKNAEGQFMSGRVTVGKDGVVPPM